MITRKELGSLQDYEKMELSIPLEKMVELHTQMLEEIGTDEDALELYEEDEAPKKASKKEATKKAKKKKIGS